MLIAGLVVGFAILATRLSSRLGVPALLLFLATGMLVGSDGPGGIWFDDAGLAWRFGVVALSLLLFSAGLDTEARSIRAVLAPGLVLASVGVALSAGLTATFYAVVFHRPIGEAVLLGAIVSSTDAAAVFGVLRTTGIRLRGRIQPLLEMESGSNDPVAIYLTLAATAALAGPPPGVGAVLGGMVGQMVLGLGFGLAGGRALSWSINRLRVGQEGLYPVFATALSFVVFGGTALAHGSAFVAVYVAGIVAGAGPLIHRRAIVRFHDALAWLAQISMFVLLGLLVFPSRLPSVAGEGIAIAAFLLFVARPVSVFASLTPFGFPLREQAMVAWVGLRGAVPIVLAAWPRVMGIDGSERIFDIVFFVVVLSVLVQGVTLPRVARWLGVAEPSERPEHAIAAASGEERGARAVRLVVGAAAHARSLIDLGLPAGALVALVEHEGEQIVPQGGTVLHEGDVALVMLQAGQEPAVRVALGAPLAHRDGPPAGLGAPRDGRGAGPQK